MRLSSLTSLDTWKGLSLETAWMLAPAPPAITEPPTWRLEPRELEDVQVLWPLHYEWAPSRKWVDPLQHGIRKYVSSSGSEIPQTFPGIVLIQIVIRGVPHDVAIDYSDLPAANEDCARRCSLYFKMQFSRGGYSLNNIVPGGFVPNSEDIYTYLRPVRVLADRKSYRYDVYGRFGLEFASEIRRGAHSILTTQKDFAWEGSLRIRRYSLALCEIARSKICIDLPGKGDFCFRLIDYLAVGACIIAPRHHNVLHVPLVDREHIVYVEEDLSNLVETCKFYLENDDAREQLRRNSRLFFDKYLHREQLAAYYLRCCLDKLF